MLDRLLNNLHPGINKDPQKMDALSVTGSGTIIIQNNTMQLIGSAVSAQFNLRSYTLSSLIAAINGVAGFSATSPSVSNLSASVLITGTYTVPANIPMFTSFLWQLLKPAAVAMLDALGAENDALLEMIMNTSDGSWLDSFGELFGVDREVGEPDQLYAIRIFDLSVAPRVNNMAIQKTLRDIQYVATVDDDVNTSFKVNVTLPSNPPQGFIYSTAQMRDIIDKIRLAGVSYTIVSKGALTDAGVIGDSYTVSKSSAPVKYGSGRKWGQGIWGN